MNKSLKAASMLLALASSIYLPGVSAAPSTDMLITIAETNPVLVERLHVVALNDTRLLNQLLKMADSKPEKLERLLNLAETDPEAFKQIVTISDAEVVPELGGNVANGINDGGLKW